jgi:hypothetical protein
MMPDDTWRSVYQSRLEGKITPDSAKKLYVESYREGLEALGYHAFSHPVREYSRVGSRREMYQLIFATQHRDGEKIMKWVFKRPYVLDFPVSLQKPLFEH